MKLPILILCTLLTASLAAPSDPVLTNPKLKSISTGADSNTNILKVDATTGALTRVTIPAPDLSSYAPLASPTFTGAPTVPTAAAEDESLQIANTQWITDNVLTPAAQALGLKAPLAAPAFTGVATFAGQLTILEDATLRFDDNTLFSYGASSAVNHRTALGLGNAATLTVDADLATLALPAATTISAFGGSLIDDTDAATARATLGLGNAATLTVDADIATLVLPASTTISTYGSSLIDDADAATARATLGLGTLATQSGTFSGTFNGTFSGTSSGTNTGDQTLSDATITTTDITTNNATTAKHGFLKKLSNISTEYMDGTGAWSVPPGGTGANPTASLGLTAVNGVSTNFMRSDAAPALDISISPTWTGAHTIKNDALGTTTAARLSLTNTTAAAAGAQQVSPAWFMRGNGWKTNATAASQTVDFQAYVLPVQGAANPTGNLTFQSSVNGAAMATAVQIGISGTAATSTASGALIVTGGLGVNGTIYGSAYQNNGWNCFLGAADTAASGVGLGQNHVISWANSASTTTVTGGDLFLRRKTSANLQQGAADAAAPVAQTSSVQSVIAGTSNTAGADRTYTGSQGTGTGNGGSLIFQTAPPGSTGTAQNALSTRKYTFGGEKSLTESAATPIFSIALGTSKYLGGQVVVTTHADDGTDFQATTETFTFSAVNKAGAVTTSIQATPASSTTATTSGTLTTAWTIGATGTQVEVKNNAVSSLTQTTLKVSYQLILNGDGTNTVTP